MAEQHEQSSFIKTPKQLIVVLLLALIVPVLLAVMLAQLATGGRKGTDSSEEAVAQRIQPVAKVELAAPAPQAAPAASAAAPAPTAAAADKGKQVFEAACAACHATGVAGAPKLGDKTAWGPRLGAGVDGLTASAMKGKGAMPPKGGNASLPDADLKAAVAYMVSQAK